MNLIVLLVVAGTCLWGGYQLRQAVAEFELARAAPQQAAEIEALWATQYLSAQAWLARQAMFEAVEDQGLDQQPGGGTAKPVAPPPPSHGRPSDGPAQP